MRRSRLYAPALLFAVACSSAEDEPGTDASPGVGFSATTEASGEQGSTASDESGSTTVRGCDPAKQDCPDGEKCSLYATDPASCCVDATQCVPIIGGAVEGDACTRENDNDDCARGFFCLAGVSNGSGPGRCGQLCDVDAEDPCGGANRVCRPFNDGTAAACITLCNPLSSDECFPHQGCYRVPGDQFICLPAATDGAGADGDACEAPQQCAPGLVCAQAATQGGCDTGQCCTPVCDTREPDPCGAAEVCVPNYGEGMAPPGQEFVGVCGLPT